MIDLRSKIYLAGKWEEHSLIAMYAERLLERGYEISFPWFLLHLENTPLRQAAAEDLQGVLEADIFIAIFERELPYKGSMTELGCALASGKRVIVIGHGGDANVFVHHPLVERVGSFDELLNEVL
jgi:nucleoside 2-deoxyribosyltransferase